MKLALIGYGALGHYIEDMISEAHEVDASATIKFDDNLHQRGEPSARPFAEHEASEFAGHTFFLCIGYKHLRRKRDIAMRLLELGRSLPSYVHHSSYVHPSVKIGAGSMVYPGCSVDRGVTIGTATWITNADVIAHDSRIGDACWFGATVTISGIVTVGDCTFIGSGTTIANDAVVGANAIIGMGTAVTKHVPDGASVIGNPMRILTRPLTLV